MDIRTSIEDTFQREADTIRNLAETVDQGQMENVMRTLMECSGKIIVSGCGTSGAAAEKIKHTLSCAGCPAFFLSPSYALHGGMGVVQKEDVLVLLSNGGRTDEINRMIEPCRTLGAKVIAVTGDETSPMAENSDLVLKVRVEKEADDHNILATGSILAVLAVFDAIAIAITRLRGFSEQEFLRIHPGGGVGKRLAGDRGEAPR